MNVLTGKRAIVTASAAGTIALLGLTGCGSGPSSTQNVGANATTSTMPTAAAAPISGAAEPFGPACAAAPTDPANPGSIDGMSKDPVATAASNNPALTTLAKAVTAADLGDTLNSAQDITVFAPYNEAFGKIPSDQLNQLLADKDQLTKVLTYHVVPGKLSPDQVTGTHKTLEGGDLTVTGSNQNFTVNGNSKVICGDVQTANATVYIVDTVLMPQS